MSTQFSPKVLKNIKLNLKLFFRGNFINIMILNWKEPHKKYARSCFVAIITLIHKILSYYCSLNSISIHLSFAELNEPPRHKRGADVMPNSVRDFIHLIGRTNSDSAKESGRTAAININSSLDYMATDFTTHVLPHLNRLLGKIRVLQENGADIGSHAQASISFVQDSLGKTVSDIDGTIVQRATN